MSALVGWTAVQGMLTDCAAGYTWDLKLHFRQVHFNGQTYPTLPKHDEIEVGHIRKMVRFLKIDPKCAKRKIPTMG